MFADPKGVVVVLESMCLKLESVAAAVLRDDLRLLHNGTHWCGKHDPERLDRLLRFKNDLLSLAVDPSATELVYFT